MLGRTYPHTVLLIFASIILKASCKGNGSLTFLIDDTYSMANDMRQVKSSVNLISDTVFNKRFSLIDNMVLVTFNDPSATVRVVTQDRETFKRTLEEVHAHNPENITNLDCWEPSMNGLLLALETSNHGSYIYVFTDASAKDYRDSQKVIEMCQQKQSQIVFVLTGRCGGRYGAESFEVYYDIARACGGQAFDVKINDVSKVLRTIEETIKGHTIVITQTIVPAGIQKDISVNGIEKATGEPIKRIGNIPVTPQAPPKVLNGTGSLTFLIDDTASMGDYIRKVKSSVNHISDTVFDKWTSQVGNMVLITFNDTNATVRAVTQDRNTFKITLDAVHAHSIENITNLDCWKPSMNGLLLALETSNRGSYIYVFTDARAKDYRDSKKVTEMCQEKQSQIAFMLTGRCRGSYGSESYDVYSEIVQACAGQTNDVIKN